MDILIRQGFNPKTNIVAPSSLSRKNSVSFASRQPKYLNLNLPDMIAIGRVRDYRANLTQNPLLTNPEMPLTVSAMNDFKKLTRSVIFKSTPGFEQVVEVLRHCRQKGMAYAMITDNQKGVDHLFVMRADAFQKGQIANSVQMADFDKNLEEMKNFVPSSRIDEITALNDEEKIDTFCKKIWVIHKKG